MLPALRLAHGSGEFTLRSCVTLDGIEIGISTSFAGKIGHGDVIQGRAAPERIYDELNASNGEHISALEAAIRANIFETWYFWKQHALGFENSSLLSIAPFLGSRGGPCIEGEYTLTMEECRQGARFDDVMYRYNEFRAMCYACEHGGPKWVDVPYRVMLPKMIDGLLAVGRCASGKPDTLLRNRMACKVMGEACGIAAALSAQSDISPKQLDIRTFQNALLDAGFHLGDRKRLRELQLG